MARWDQASGVQDVQEAKRSRRSTYLRIPQQDEKKETRISGRRGWWIHGFASKKIGDAVRHCARNPASGLWPLGSAAVPVAVRQWQCSKVERSGVARLGASRGWIKFEELQVARRKVGFSPHAHSAPRHTRADLAGPTGPPAQPPAARRRAGYGKGLELHCIQNNSTE